MIRRWNRALVLALPWAWLALFLLAPLAIVLRIAFAESTDGVPPYLPRYSTDSFALVLGDPLYADALLLSLRVAGISTLACLLIGYPMALAIARSRMALRDPLLLAAMLPFWTGFLPRINAWIGLLKDDGPINAALMALGVTDAPVTLLYTDFAMYVGITYTYLPFMVLPLYARLSRQDPALLDAAADLGAPPWRAFATVTLPLSLPGVWAGSMLVFVPAVGEYVIPDLLGGPRAQMVGRVLWDEFFANRDWPAAAALAIALLAVLVILPASLLTLVRALRAHEPAA